MSSRDLIASMVMPEAVATMIGSGALAIISLSLGIYLACTNRPKRWAEAVAVGITLPMFLLALALAAGSAMWRREIIEPMFYSCLLFALISLITAVCLACSRRPPRSSLRG